MVGTFKIITLATALEENIVNLEEEHFYDGGAVSVGGATIHCWKHGGHGEQTFLQVVENSCNLGGYTGTFLSSKMLIEDAYINKKSHSNIEVYSTFNLIYNNVIYSKNEDYPILERKVKVENCRFKSEEDNINNVIYNNDTSNYKDITYNKKDVKQFDLQNKLKIRKGYENTSLSYYLIVEDINNLEYAFELANELYNYLKQPQEPICELLFKNISNRIMELGDNIVCNKLYRDYRFKSKRNFISISKRKYGLYVRLLKVEDNQNILDYTYQTGAEPLCMTYKIFNKNDIETIIPYIIKSYNLSKCVAVDVKNK